MPTETAEEVNPGLRALFDVELPEEPTLAKAATDTDATAEFAPEPEKPKPAKPAEPEPTTTETVKPDAAKSDLTARLAPDFAAADETPPAAATEEDHPEVTEEMIKAETDPKRQASLRALGKALQELKNANRDLKSKSSTAPSVDAETKALLEQTQKERDELLARIERANLLDSPKFQKEHLEPRNKEFAQAIAIVKDSGADPAELQHAIGMNGKARVEALDELREKIPSEMMRGRFDRLIESIDNRTADINARLNNAKTEAEQERIQNKVRQQEEFQKIEKTIDALLASARRDLVDVDKFEVLQKVGKPGFELWDEQVDGIDSTARNIALKITPENIGIVAYSAASTDSFRRMFHAERAARIAVENELAEMKGAGPKITQERKAAAPDSSSNGSDTPDIIANLRAGKYQTR